MNNNELIQENFNSSLEVNNPFSSAVNPLETTEIVDTGSFSSPSLDIANEPTATEIESLIEIASPINSDSFTTSEDLLTGTNGKNTALLNVADDLVDPNFNLLDPPTESVTQKDSIAVDLNNFESDNNAKLSDFLETNSLEIIKNLEKSDRPTEISQKIDDFIESDSLEQSDYNALVKRFEANKNSLVEIPEDNLNSTSENGASATANLLEKESNNQEIEIKEVNNNNSASKSDEDSGEESDSEEDDDKKEGKGDRDIEDKKDKDRNGDKDNEKEGKGDRDGDGDGDKDNEKEKDGDGGEIEIEGLKKAIAFLEKNDIFNLPKNISEVSIEVETGKKGLNKLLQNQQFNALLEQLGLPTGNALKNKLKGDEVEIEKEIKLPDGSTLSLELEAEEGQIEFSLEIERDDDDGGGVKGIVKGGVKGIRNIAGNVLNSLIDAGTGNLADILRNQIGLKIDREDLQDLISGEEGVGEILEDLGRSAIRKLAEYPLQQLKNAFEINPQQILDFLGQQVGLNSEQISSFTKFFSGQGSLDDLLGSSGINLLLGDKNNLVASLNPISIIGGSGLFDLGTIQGILNAARAAGDNIGSAVRNYVDNLDPKKSIQFYYQVSGVLDILFRDARDGELYGDSVGIDKDLFKQFVDAYNEVHEYMLKLYKFALDTNFSEKPDPQLWENWKKAVNALKERYKDIVDTDPETFGDLLVSANLGRLTSEYIKGAEPDNLNEWKDFFGNYYEAIRGLKTDLLPKSEQEKKEDLERLSLTLNLIPGINIGKAAIELAIQQDVITGREFTFLDNIFTIAGLGLDAFGFVKFGNKLVVTKGDDAFEVIQGGKTQVDNLTLRAVGGQVEEFLDNYKVINIKNSQGEVFDVAVQENSLDAFINEVRKQYGDDAIEILSEDEAALIIGGGKGPLGGINVPKPTAQQYQIIDQYTEALRDLRTALLEGNQQAANQARTILDNIELNAIQDDILLEHIDTLANARQSLEEGALLVPYEESPGNFVEGIGRQFNSQSAQFGSFRGKTYSEIEDMIGRPPDSISGAGVEQGGSPSAIPTGAVRLTWRFEDNSFIHIDIPGIDNANRYELNRIPHIARTAPVPYDKSLELTDTGIGVPVISTPAHIEFQRDAKLNQRIRELLQTRGD